MNGWRGSVGAALLLLTGCACEEGGGSDLHGVAEDLWGNRIDLAECRSGVTLIQPVSPSNCGYCLVDGGFVEANYHERNRRRGGTSYLTALFNPQIDVQTWVKHFRAEETPVLTAPLDLHRHHENGFPWIAAFVDGERVYAGGLHPYEETVRRLAPLLWPGEETPVLPTGPMHMATRFVYENEGGLGVYVVPDGDGVEKERMEERIASWRGEPLVVKEEGDLTDEDYRKNLLYRGRGERFRLDPLRAAEGPVRIEEEAVLIGPHRFLLGETAVAAAVPNPRNRERYLVLELTDGEGRLPARVNYLDFAVARGGETLLEGRFAARDGRWIFADSLSRKGPGPEEPRVGRCGIPAMGAIPKGEGRPAPRVRGERSGWTLGGRGARFPSLAPRRGGGCWVAWEEGGDIDLVSVGGSGPGESYRVEEDGSDSFHPVVVEGAGDDLWIFYLNDRSGFYRLYGRRLGGAGLGPPVLVSAPGPFDAVTPTAAADGEGRIAVIWSEWRANFRYPKYRTIEEGVLGEVREGSTVPSGIDYVNAWSPSLAFGAGGDLWGAWNQHYPATLGVAAGEPSGDVVSVTGVGERIEEAENGGYPSACVDGDGGRWVVWESFAWDVLSGKPQRILASRYSEGGGGWTLAETVTPGDGVSLRQTPKAVRGADGGLVVVWSERREGEEGWSIRAAHRTEAGWSVPARIAGPEENGRAPSIVAGEDGLYAAWHAGRGEGMTVRVVRLGGRPPA